MAWNNLWSYSVSLFNLNPVINIPTPYSVSGYIFRSIAGGFLVSSKCCFFFLYCFVLFALYLTEVVKSRVRQLSSLGIVVDGTKAKPQQGNQTEGGEISPARFLITNQRDYHWQIHSTYNFVSKANMRLNQIRRISKGAWCWGPNITWCSLLIEIFYKRWWTIEILRFKTCL